MNIKYKGNAYEAAEKINESIKINKYYIFFIKCLKAWNDIKKLNFKGNFKIWKITMVKV